MMLVIVLALGFCLGQVISSIMLQTSLAQTMLNDATNATLFASSIGSENGTNITSSGTVGKQSVGTPIAGNSNDTNTTRGGQPTGEFEETLFNESERINHTLANRSQEASIISEYLESESLDRSIPCHDMSCNEIQCPSTTSPCIGTDEDDLMTALAFDDRLTITMFGRMGDDILASRASAVIYGEDGEDTIQAGSFSDFADGGNGEDNMYSDTGDDVFMGGPDDDIITGGRHDDGLWGGPGNDVIRGEEGDDGAGPRTFGSPVINGEEGNDYLIGGVGADLINGGADNDTIFSGDDTSRYDGSKDIVNCGSGIDEVWLSERVDKDTVNEDCEILHSDTGSGPRDSDNDGVPDNIDNCKDIKNSDQLDSDETGPNPDGKGDACDADDDNDRRVDPADNCGYKRGSPLAYNPDQKDMNHNGWGDDCDGGV